MEEADFGLCGDKTFWATDSYGESGECVIGRVNNNHGVTKGGQTVFLRHFNRIGLHAYMHRHKLHMKIPVCTMMGKIEVKNLIEDIKTMCHTPKYFSSNDSS